MLKRTQFYQSIIGMIASASDVWELSLITRLVKKTSVPNGTNGAIADAIENKYPRIVPSQYHDYYKKVIEEIRAYDETEGDNMLDEAAEVGADIPNQYSGPMLEVDVLTHKIDNAADGKLAEG